MRRIKIIIFSWFVLNAAIAVNKNTEGLSSQSLQRLTTVISNIKNHYYKAITEDDLLHRAIKGMLAGLDPHSAYLGVEDLQDLEMRTFGRFGGIGVEVVSENGAIKVITPIDDTPADRAGIKAGDYIIQINNKFVRDMKLRDVVSIMRGNQGSWLSLTILRKNEHKPRIIRLRREIIKIKTIKYKLLESGYGYIRIAAFQEATEKDMEQAIEALKKLSKGKLQGIVLDIRNNPGGLFDSAVKVADNFLDAKKLKNNAVIVYTKGQDEAAQLTVKATPGELLPNVPIAVLINAGSASAAEIVAGALQDHKRAIVVGAPSFGKGSVQVLLPIDKKSAIKLTTALYYTPHDHLIQATGIVPDINIEEIRLPRDNIQSWPKIYENTLLDHIQNGRREIHSTEQNRGNGNSLQQSKAVEELAYKDYQLYTALNILKGLHIMQAKNS